MRCTLASCQIYKILQINTDTDFKICNNLHLQFNFVPWNLLIKPTGNVLLWTSDWMGNNLSIPHLLQGWLNCLCLRTHVQNFRLSATVNTQKLLVNNKNNACKICSNLRRVKEKGQTNLIIWWDLELLSFSNVSPICLWAAITYHIRKNI